MNLYNFNQVGGFPMNTDVLGGMQTAYSLFNALGALAGEKAIISGCNDIGGGTISDGVVFIGGEVLTFKGGAVQDKVIVVEDATNLVFGNGNSYPVVKTRYARFGPGVDEMNWADFKKPVQTNTLEARLAAIEKKTAIFQLGGGMVLWNKPANQIPEGWAEVVNWRGRIPVGFDATQAEFDEMGKTGGAKNKTLAVIEIPEHDHDSILWSSGAKALNTSGTGPVVSGGGGHLDSHFDSSGRVNKTGKTGGGQAFSILNPYRVVLFIEFIG